MARGRAANYDHQREEILAHAAALFARHGYASASMNQVAQASGLSKAALYHYFRDKYGLLVELAEGHVEELHALVDDVMALPVTPQVRLERLITGFVEAYAGAQHAHRVLTEDTRFLNDEDRERVLKHERAIVASFAQAIAAHRPELASAELDKPLTMLLFGMINWMFTWFKPDRAETGALDHDTLAPIVVDLFLGGCAAVALRHGRPTPNLSAGSPRATPSARPPRTNKSPRTEVKEP